MSGSVTSLFDIASLVTYLYGSEDGVTPQLPSDNGTWSQLNFQSPISSEYASQIGFSAEAFQNAKTGEIAIVFRGTVPSIKQNLVEDLLLGQKGILSATNPILIAAVEYANAVAAKNPDSTITLTGHSLGGYLAEAATVSLLDGPCVALHVNLDKIPELRRETFTA